MNPPRLEGELTVTVALRDLAVERVQIDSTRAPVADRLLAGRGTAEALALVPALFSVCGRSQALAARLAVAAARGEVPTAAQLAQDSEAIRTEIAQETLRQAVFDWPRASGHTPAPTVMAQLRAALQPGLAVTALRELVESQVLGQSAAAWLDLHVAGFEIWIARATTPAEHLLAAVQRDGPRHGAGGVALLPSLSRPDVLDAVLAALAADPHFEQTPRFEGQPAETGALARQHAQPLVFALQSAYGGSTLVRLVARLTELAALVAGAPAPQPLAGCRRLADGAGVGWVETARGVLLHRVELAGEKVRSWRILAPTEWNFHPHGALAAGLRAAHVGSRAELRHRAEWLIGALDPCVAYRLELVDA